MEVKLGKAPSSKKEEEVEVVQVGGVVLQRPPAKLRRGGCFNGGGEGEAPPWLGVERE